MSTQLARARKIARKDHRCSECSRTITKGERYDNVKVVGDYGFQTWKCCDGCERLCQDLWDAGCIGENEDGADCFAYLPEVEWHDVRLWSDLWAARADAFLAQWTAADGSLIAYPSDSPTEEGDKRNG